MYIILFNHNLIKSLFKFPIFYTDVNMQYKFSILLSIIDFKKKSKKINPIFLTQGLTFYVKSDSTSQYEDKRLCSCLDRKKAQ